MDAGSTHDAGDEGSRELSDGLRNAFIVVAQSPLPDDEKARWQQRLIAVTNAAKRDVLRAQASLQRFWNDWHDEFPS